MGAPFDDLKGVAEYAGKALDGIGNLLELGAQVAEVITFITAARERVEAMANQNRGPSNEEWEAQDEMIAQLRGPLHSDDS